MTLNAPKPSSASESPALQSLGVVDLFSVRGKVALVTGGSSGIGLMIAQGYVEAGVRVYISSRKKDVCDAVAAELGKRGSCFAIATDVATSEGRQGLVDELSKRE